VTPAAGLASAFSVLFAAKFLSRNFTPVEEGASLIGVPRPDQAVIVDLVFGRMPGGSLMLLPNQRELAGVMLSSGEVFLIIAGLVKLKHSSGSTSLFTPLQSRAFPKPYLMPTPTT
jgi:hypothetical protein